MRLFVKYLIVIAFVSGLCACSQAGYMQVRRGTAARTGVPTPDAVAALTRHSLTAERDTAFDVLLRLLQAEECLIESADKASGVVAARQMLCDGNPIMASMGEIRQLSFLVLPADTGSEVRLTVYTGYQWYSGESKSYYMEQMGMATDPEVYRKWFSKIDAALTK